MKTIKNWFFSIIMVMSIGGTLIVPILPEPVFAGCGDATFLGFPAWYKGLEFTDTTTCNIKMPDGQGAINTFVWTIALNVIGMALAAVGYIAVFFIMYGGFTFIVNSGNTDVSAKARQTILNAVIGLIIAISSIAIVNLIAGIIK